MCLLHYKKTRPSDPLSKVAAPAALSFPVMQSRDAFRAPTVTFPEARRQTRGRLGRPCPTDLTFLSRGKDNKSSPWSVAYRGIDKPGKERWCPTGAGMLGVP